MPRDADLYDFFVSYARVDNVDGWVEQFLEALIEEHTRFTGGRSLNYFFDRQDIPNFAIDLNNLAQLHQATNRLADAEPLMRRHVEIFAGFGRRTGYEHPHMRAALGNYRRLLTAKSLPEHEIDRRLREFEED